MAAPRKSSPTPKKTTASRDTTKRIAKAPSPTAMATRVKPVRTIPTGPIVRSKTLANGEPRPKSRRSK